MKRISVIGGGAWGTALAASLARSGHAPKLWMRDEKLAEEMASSSENMRFLPEIPLPEGIQPTTDVEALKGEEIVLLVVPTQALRDVLTQFLPHLSKDAVLVLCAKGIEQTTGKRVSEIAKDVMPENRIAVLSGPSFAHDVARGLPTAVTLAAPELGTATELAQTLGGPSLRPYASDDITGVELGGALKNVIALAVGVARGRMLGASAEAALATRGFAELSRIARHFGAKPETLMGLSCLGDLILTCSSPQSRNFAYGMAIGKGDDLKDLKLAEGVFTTSIAAKICANAGISAPIIEAVDAVLREGADINEIMKKLLARPLKAEIQT